MTAKVYQVKDLNWYKLHSDEDSIQIDCLDGSLSIGKSIFAPVHHLFEELTTRRSMSKKLPKIGPGYYGSRPIRIKELSVPLPSVSKREGNIVSYLPNAKRFSKISHKYLRSEFIRKQQQYREDISNLHAKGHNYF